MSHFISKIYQIRPKVIHKPIMKNPSIDSTFVKQITTCGIMPFEASRYHAFEMIELGEKWVFGYKDYKGENPPCSETNLLLLFGLNLNAKIQTCF